MLDAKLLASRIEGVNLSAGTLGEELGDRPTLLVLLRHLGCIFCREMVKDVRAAAASDPAYPPLLFFFAGTPADGEPFFAKYYPGARAVADVDYRFYDALDVGRAPAVQLLSPRLLIRGVAATLKGNMQGFGRILGDPLRMPGVLLVQRERVLWRHEFKHAGDHPDFRSVPDLVRLHAAETNLAAEAFVA